MSPNKTEIGVNSKAYRAAIVQYVKLLAETVDPDRLAAEREAAARAEAAITEKIEDLERQLLLARKHRLPLIRDRRAAVHERLREVAPHLLPGNRA